MDSTNELRTPDKMLESRNGRRDMLHTIDSPNETSTTDGNCYASVAIQGMLIYRTEIMHKQNLHARWLINADWKHNGPSFIMYDHRDHLHVIHYSNEEGTNTA